MSLKQHNTIVQKLLKELQTKDTQVQSLKKQLLKCSIVPSSQLKSQQSQKQFNKKINQLHKQYKQKIQLLNQNVKGLNLEVTNLKQKIVLINNIDAKHKQQIAEMLKKFDLTSVHDPKFSAMISHYQTVLSKKDKKIHTLQKQLKQFPLPQNAKPLKIQSTSQQDDDSNPHSPSQQSNKIPLNTQQHIHTKYQHQINQLKNQCNKYQKLFQEKSCQYKSVTKQYSELTKQYYTILNNYNLPQPTTTTSTKTNHKQPIPHTKTDKKLQQLLHQCNNAQQQSSITELSYSFLPNYNKFIKGNNQYQIDNSQFVEQRQLQSLRDLIENVMQLLGIQNKLQIIPTITKLQIKCQNVPLLQNISSHIQQLIFPNTPTKIPITDLLPQLTKLSQKFQHCNQTQTLLSQLCLQMGTKQQKLLQKLKDLQSIYQQFFINMRNINYVKQLSHTNKIIQFINYFQLDQQQCQLPQQLLKLYNQLKTIDKFIKQSLLILNKQTLGFQRTLQMILRYLQRKQAQEHVQNKDGKAGKCNNSNK